MNTFSTFDPFREIDRVFGSISRGPAAPGMPMDLYRDEDRFIVEVDLPGVDPSTIDIDVDDRSLTIRAERVGATAETGQWLTRERPTGSFARQLTLGRGLATDKIDANYADGVLRLVIPVADEAKPRKITVAHEGQRGLDAPVQGEVAAETDAA